MNPEFPNDPRSALEASLTALLLGELPHEEAAALHQKLAQDAELAALYERLKHTIALVRETVATPAEQTKEPLLPLRLSEQRRQKLLQHLKTVAPKEFARPRRSPTRWLVPVGIAAGLTLILGALLLPTLGRSKARSQRLALETWSLSQKGESAAPAKLSTEASTRRVREAARGFTERYASGGEVRGGVSVVPSAAPAAPKPPVSLGSAIVLPDFAATTEEAVAPSAGLSGQIASRAAGQVEHFYDASSAGVGRVSSGGTYGGFAQGGGGVRVPEGRPAEVASARYLYSEPDVKNAAEADRLARAYGRQTVTPQSVTRGAATYGLSSEAPPPPPPQAVPPPGVANMLTAGQPSEQPAAPAAAPVTTARPVKGVEVAGVPMQLHDGDLTAGDLALRSPEGVSASQLAHVEIKGGLSANTEVARADTAKKPAYAPELTDSFQAGAGLKAGEDKLKDDRVAGYAMAGRPSVRGGSYGYASETGESLGLKYRAGRPTDTSDLSSTDGSKGTAKNQWYFGEGVTPNFSVADGQQAPALGDTPMLGSFYRQSGADVAPGGKAKVEEKVRSLELGYALAPERQGSAAEGKQDGRTRAERTIHSLGVLDYADAGAFTKSVTATPTQPARRARSAIALPSTKGDTALALNDTSAVEQKVRDLPRTKPMQEMERRGRSVNGRGEPDLAKKTTPAANAPVPQPEVQTSDNAFSTFSLNVSDVSLKLAAASLEKGVMPDVASLRSEEFLNAFDYRDPEPPPGVPVAFAWERAQDPFAQGRDLLRFSVKTAALGRQPGRPLNLVLLLDNSGSMERADRVHIIREALRALADQLQPQDKLSVITFSRTPRLFADGAPGTDAEAIALALTELTPQGGTNLEDAMDLAYQTALRHYLANGVNRVVLLTDGAANLGNVEPEALKAKVETNRKQGIALDCFGIGWEGYNDDLLEVLSRNGDGRYGFVNSPEEAATEFAGQLAGALHVAASDVKVQVEFNPARVTAYRQIGYAKHQLKKEQFRDNTVDAAEIAAAESGNALYVIAVNPAGNGPLATVRVRYKVPGTSDYKEHEWPVPYDGNAVALEQASPAMRLAAVSSAFAEWLASSPYAAEVTPDRLLKYLAGVPDVYGADQRPKKLEWMIRQAKSLAGK